MNVTENVKSGATAVKNHIVKYKMVYAIGTTAIVCIAGTWYFTNSVSIKNIIDSNKIQINSPTTNNVEITNIVVKLPARGHRGLAIFDETAKKLYGSQNEAADALGVSPSAIAQHLKGKRPNVAGHVLKSMGENLHDEVTMAA